MERLCFMSTVSPKPLPLSSSLRFYNHRLSAPAFPRRTISANEVMNKGNTRRGFGPVCFAGPVLSLRNYRFISTVSSVVLMVSRGTPVNKSFIVPLFLLQAPPAVISWIKSEYGVWAAFLALLVRLFFFIPGELELPLMALLLVIVAPHQVMNLRGTREGAIIALLIVGYLAFQHFSWAGDLQRAFDRGALVATLATICLTVTSLLLLV